MAEEQKPGRWRRAGGNEGRCSRFGCVIKEWDEIRDDGQGGVEHRECVEHDLRVWGR